MSDMKSVLKKKTYYLATHPDYPGVSVENFGDREFIIRHSSERWYQGRSYLVNLGGDPRWDITEENIHAAADYLLGKKLQEMNAAKEAEKKIEEAKKSKYPSYCCQKCGEEIGWVGRFLFSGMLHECKK